MDPDLPPEPTGPPSLRLGMLIAGLSIPPLILLVPLCMRDPGSMLLLTFVGIFIGWAVFGRAVSARYRGISLYVLLLAYLITEAFLCAALIIVAILRSPSYWC